MDNLSSVNRLWISSDEFEVSRAIPSSECVSIGGSLQKYYYQAIYEHHYGTRAVPVTASVTYTLTWNDGRTHREQVTVTKSVEVPREYSYWKIRTINLCYLKMQRCGMEHCRMETCGWRICTTQMSQCRRIQIP